MPSKITVDGLSLRTTGQPLVGEWNCYESQLKARHAFHQSHEYHDSPESFYMLNYAPTGGGKTMSWSDSVIRQNIDTIVVYPTNALIQDQTTAIKEQINSDEFYDKSDEVTTLTVTAEMLEREREKRAGDVGNNGDLFSTLVREKKREYESVIVFTNPDIFSNLRNDIYQNSFARRVSELFELIVVDEFHWADISGKCSLLNQLEQIRADEQARTTKCMLLSATPDQRVIEKLKAGNAPVFDLTDGTNPLPHSDAKDNDEYRTVLPPTEVEFRRGQTFQVGDALMSQKWRQNTVDFCKQEKKTVIMLDSQKEVSKVTSILSRELPADHKIYQIDGKNQVTLRQDIEEFNTSDDYSVLVSNSAVEVGIDFKCDQIIFSGTSSDRMLQRFGRLRNRSETLRAIAYVPHQFVEAIEETSEDMITRTKLRDIIEDVYYESRRPHSYPPTFGAHEAYEQVLRHANQTAPEKKEEKIEKGKERIANQQLKPFDVEVDWDEFHREHQKMDGLLDTLLQYRSGAPSTVVYDVNNKAIKSHELGGILRTGDIEIVDRSEFKNRIPSTEDAHSKVDRLERYSHGYIIYHGNEYTRNADKNIQDRKVMLAPTAELQEMLMKPVEERLPTELNSFKVIVNERDLSPIDVGPLNDELTDASPLIYPIELGSFEAQAELGLDSFFFLTDIAAHGKNGASVAMGQNALYLHCIMQENLYRKNPDRDDLSIKVPKTVWNS